MLGKQKVKFVRAWQTYQVGEIIQPPATLRGWLLANGYVELVEIEMPNRPARLAAKAARKVAEGSKRLFS